MKKTLPRHSVLQAKRQKASDKSEVMKCKAASGVSYTVRYPVPKVRKGYHPNEASQFIAPDASSLAMSGGW